MIKRMKWGGMMLASLLAVSSCQNEEVISNEQQKGNYSLKVSSLVDSRTYVKDDGTVVWSKGDKLYVYGNNVSGVLTLTEGADNSTGTFSGFVFGNPDNLKWAVFGDDVKGTTNGAQFTISEITDPNSNSPMVGEIKNGNVDLEHLCGMVRITIKNLPENADVKLTGDNIAGTVEWDGETINVIQSEDEIAIKVASGNQTIEVPVFVTEETEKTFSLFINGQSCEFTAPIAVGSLSQNGINEIVCILNENGELTFDAGTPIVSVPNADGLIEALETGNNVSFNDDIKIDPAGMSNAYGKTGINVKNGQSIYGNGHTLDVKGAGGTWDTGINTTGGLIKDLTITGSFRGVFVNHNSDHSETVILENVIIDGTTYTISCDQGKNQNLEAYNSTFNGWTSYAATIGTVKFDGCKFGKGNGYATCRPYAPTEFIGCEFEEGYKIDPRAKVTFKNCTLNGVTLTNANLSTLVTSNITNATIK